MTNTLNTSIYSTTNNSNTSFITYNSPGLGTLNYSNPVSVTGNSFIGSSALLTVPVDSNTLVLEEKAALEVKGKIIINGEDLNERLARIETLLTIPTRNIDMENKYPKLKKLWQEYMQEIEKYKTWERIKE